jgi:O-antigen ligase
MLYIALCWGAAVAWIATRLSARDKATALYAGLVTLAIPLLTGALLVNLKRGPWFGVVTGVALLCAFFARKSLIAVIATITLTVAAFPAIQTRLTDSYTDFTIAGGRSTIWQIGADLCSKFPMGVGYRNSGILRSFSHEIPEELDHFHNNLLNITAENGWLATVLFVWLIFTTLRLCFSRPKEPLLVAIGCAILSWQLAGVVEYNAGDAEVLIMVWLLLGVAMKLLGEGSVRRSST